LRELRLAQSIHGEGTSRFQDDLGGVGDASVLIP